MAKKDRELLSQLTSEGVKGPFITIMLNTHVAHQDVEKDQIKFKNFAKEAKKRFEKKYAEHDWSNFQKNRSTTRRCFILAQCHCECRGDLVS